MSVFKNLQDLENVGKNSKTFKDPQEPCFSVPNFCGATVVLALQKSAPTFSCLAYGTSHGKVL